MFFIGVYVQIEQSKWATFDISLYPFLLVSFMFEHFCHWIYSCYINILLHSLQPAPLLTNYYQLWQIQHFRSHEGYVIICGFQNWKRNPLVISDEWV